MTVRSPDHRGSWLYRPRAQLVKYSAVAGATTRGNLTYLADFFLRSAFLVIVMFVFFQLWRTTYSATGENRIGGFDLREMIWYLAMTEAIVMSLPRISSVVDEQVKSGQLAYYLCRPHSYLLYLLSTYFGEIAVRLPVSLLVAGFMAFLFVGRPPFEATCLPGLAAVIVLGLALDFVLSAAIGLLAFWFEDTGSFYLLYSRLLMILGGMLIPLDAFPTVFRRIALALPTHLIVYAPAKLFVGHTTSGPEVLGLIWRQALWLCLLWLGLSGLFRLGVKQVNVQGG